MIIQTTAGKFYQVSETGSADLAHCWNGYAVKKIRGRFELTTAGLKAYAAACPELVRIAGCKIVEG